MIKCTRPKTLAYNPDTSTHLVTLPHHLTWQSYGKSKNFEDCITCLFYYSLFYNFRFL